ncbi:MAG: hypothetical protein HOD85_13565, partial [Deltaproteobacteria bacterium]|nr:hypothetical protein [Deltaproteobacteria bacterium]
MILLSKASRFCTIFSFNFSIATLFILILLGLSGCKEEEKEVSTADTITVTVATPPVTSYTISDNCTAAGVGFNCAGAASVTFSVNTQGIIYYSTQGGTEPENSAQFNVVTSGESVTISGEDMASVYINYYSVDQTNIAEASRSLLLNFLDVTVPTSSLAFSSANSTSCTLSNTTYTCDGQVNATISANESASIFYETEVGSAPEVSTNSTSVSAPVTVPITSNDTYLTFFSQDSSGNSESTTNHRYNFQISGLSPSINGGYYSTQKSFKFTLNNRFEDVSSQKFQVWYLGYYGTDAAANNASTPVFDGNTNPSAGAVRYWDTYAYAPKGASTIFADTPDNDTTIFLYRYNLIYDGSQSAVSVDLTGSVKSDTEGSFALDL